MSAENETHEQIVAERLLRLPLPIRLREKHRRRHSADGRYCKSIHFFSPSCLPSGNILQNIRFSLPDFMGNGKWFIL